VNDTWWVKQEQLDEDQKAVISLPLDGSHLILGPPGSGKTNLLVLRANYMSLAKRSNIIVIVFTRTLQEFITAGSKQYSFPRSKVKTCRRWQQDFLREYGVDSQPPESFEEQRTYFIQKIDELVKKRKLKNVYDAVLLDEAHDYLPEELEIFRKLGKVLFATADSRQKIYTGEDCLDLLASLVDKCHSLRRHYRIGRKICKLADALSKDSEDYVSLSSTSNYDEKARPSSVEHFRCPEIDEQAKKIIDKLGVQMKAYPDELLGVISPKKDEMLRIWEHISKSPLQQGAVVQGGGENVSFDSNTRICVCTLHAAKGLEFRGLHIAGGEFLKKFEYQRNMAFTAVTRAKTSLSLYYSDDLPGYLEQALDSLEPPPSLPELIDVFGRK
jgi:superfamily I DNA and RNA helicase